ncbi:hypothetical protein NDU88_006069 [Pleurodeles waltl]|uniref:Secreted protein n=1 Tax=Pleurodeles waltl TaxID=8319 RepID=A0AAV7RMX0_PLEWA|nr:hypothetical protein NDU88_006069 [Pleurodeles waltl]
MAGSKMAACFLPASVRCCLRAHDQQAHSNPRCLRARDPEVTPNSKKHTEIPPSEKDDALHATPVEVSRTVDSPPAHNTSSATAWQLPQDLLSTGYRLYTRPEHSCSPCRQLVE